MRSKMWWSGKILAIEKHPDSDQLVDLPGGCRRREARCRSSPAPQNLKVGDVVPAALHGAKLPGGIEIKKGKLRGVESNGMLLLLCRAGPDRTRLSLRRRGRHSGACDEEMRRWAQTSRRRWAWTTPSSSLRSPPTAPTASRVIGLAREAAATFEHAAEPARAAGSEHGEGDIRRLAEGGNRGHRSCAPLCAPRWSKTSRSSPLPRWMRERLRAAGVRPINNIVDITNYVMLEYGQPMHAFDHRAMSKSGKIVVRHGRSRRDDRHPGRRGPHARPRSMLVIADDEKPIAVAGVMGGEYSGIYGRHHYHCV